MSARSSTWSESASSELDPLFLSLKEPGTPHNNRSRHSNALSSQSASSDTPLAIPATVNFPLPPRRLRPGEIIGIPDPGTSALPPSNHSSNHPEPFFTPVSLYGVAIGGNNPSKTNPAINGRAEVKTAGMTSLDLRKMSLRNRSSASISHPSCPPPTETISIRARNPSRMLAPHTPALHSPPRTYSLAQPALPRYQQAYSSSTSNLPNHSVDSSPRSPSRSTKSSSMLPRNLSLVETVANPIPRLPPTRLAYQSLSYNFSNTDDAHDHTLSSIRQPLSMSPDPNANSHPQLRRHLLPSPSHTPKNDPDYLPPTMNSGKAPTPADQIMDPQSHRIKFAPLPNKPIPGSNLVTPSFSFLESQSNQSKQSPRKKAAWIQRWLSPGSKTAAAKPKPEISLPVPESLILTGTGAVPSNALVAAPTVQRRSSVNQVTLQQPVRPERPRSRSFSAARPTIGMVANLVQRTPSRSIHDTVASGKSLLTGSQCIVSPMRAHSLQNLIGQNTNARSDTTQTVAPEVPSEKSQIPDNAAPPYNEPKLPTTQPDDNLDSQTGQIQHEPPNDEVGGGLTKTKKKREIRFRNTLELIPDLVFANPSPVEILITDESSPQARAEPSGYQPSHPGLHAMDLMGSDPKRRKTPMKNIGLFNHLRRPRTADQASSDSPLGTSNTLEPGRRTLQPFGSSSHYHPASQPMSTLLPSKSRTNQHLTVPDEDDVGVLSRKLAPKVNLTFVDLDHHIGSRFSVNTLLKEIHKSMPDVKPTEDSDHNEQEQSNIGESNPESARSQKPVRQYTAPVTRRELEQRTRGRQGSGSDGRLEGRDGSSSENSGSPTTATSVSNPMEAETVEPVAHHNGHDSIIEVVKTNGADVVFQMVVPAAPTQSKHARSDERLQPGRRQQEPRRRIEVPQMAYQEDALTVISERLVALNKSIEAQEAHPRRSLSVDDSLQTRRGSSLARTAVPGATRRKTKRIETWLSNVPSPDTSPEPHVNEFAHSNQHTQHLHHHNQLLLSTRHHQEVLDHPDLLDCPESPIDKLHRHLPSRLTMHRPSRSLTPTRF
ncbi:hypothetical protein Pst134EA_012007 [Puccinia striiformis f. sp. tritici]|uniref:hypothetical protein n=1 Tax=Puccinia striiformis f. sp. tritici TaxID=168172 RepID=UPI00200735E6|nr:hypothetical protein Pst134EA_012007 [Puccinia striiformis f. sp. tritici]KAH9468385.1 hypothetical protein Pst134EA_012007 [Puccinia striiformis f. sp. tritici]